MKLYYSYEKNKSYYCDKWLPIEFGGDDNSILLLFRLLSKEYSIRFIRMYGEKI